MMEKKLVHELTARRRRSMNVLPIAVLLLATLGGVIYWEDLHRSEFGFLVGVLVGCFVYWVALEFMTVVQVGRQLRSEGNG